MMLQVQISNRAASAALLALITMLLAACGVSDAAAPQAAVPTPAPPVATPTPSDLLYLSLIHI